MIYLVAKQRFDEVLIRWQNNVQNCLPQSETLAHSIRTEPGAGNVANRDVAALQTDSNKKSGISSTSYSGIDQSRTTSATVNRGQQHQSPRTGGPISSDDTDPLPEPVNNANPSQQDLNMTAKFVLQSEVAIDEGTEDKRRQHESTIHQIEAPQQVPYQHPDAIDEENLSNSSQSNKQAFHRQSSQCFYEKKSKGGTNSAVESLRGTQSTRPDEETKGQPMFRRDTDQAQILLQSEEAVSALQQTGCFDNPEHFEDRPPTMSEFLSPT